MLHHIDLFTELGRRLASFGEEDATRHIIESATQENPWFTHQDIVRAVTAIRTEMLARPKLEAWLSSYTPASTPKRVAVIMAGNLPLVGFFDLMCVLLSGHECHYKPSSKDSILMNYIVEELRAIEPQIALYAFDPAAEYDMLIATGGDSAVHHFDTHYASTRRLLRGSRHSIAVLSGTETSEELEALTEDITAYSGLGCRSVSLLFVPRGYTPQLHCSAPRCPKLLRNLRSERALRTMTHAEFVDCQGFILAPGNDFSTSLAVVHTAEYETLNDVREWLTDNGEHIQCVVSHIASLNSALPFGRVIPFGRAQYPTLDDWADGIDTLAWLTTEKDS